MSDPLVYYTLGLDADGKVKQTRHEKPTRMFQFAVEIDDREPLPHKAAHIVVRFLDGRAVDIDKSRTYTVSQLLELLDDV